MHALDPGRCLASFLVFVVLIACAQPGITDELAPGAKRIPIIVYTRMAPGPDEDGPGRMLLELVEEGKTIRVLVGIDFDMVAPHELSASDVKAQARDMAKVQRGIAQRVFEATDKNGVLWQFRDIPFMTLEVGRSQLRRVLLDPAVVTVQEDSVAQPMLKDSTDVIQADQVWNMTPTLRGKGQAIAVLDTGTNHEKMLKGRIVAGGCFSSNYWYYPSESLCAGKASSRTGLSAGSNCPTTVGGCDHGTHVATIAAGDDGSFRGVARDADIIRVQVFSKFTSRYWCGGYAPCVMSYGSDQVRGLEYVYSLRNSFDIAVFHWSLHHVPEDLMGAALEEAQRVLNENGRLFVIEPEPVGSWQEVSQPFHDETAVQAKAAQAVEEVIKARPSQRRRQYYLSEDFYDSFDGFVDSMMSHAYNRYTEDQIRQQSVRESFESCREDDTYRLCHRIRMEEICWNTIVQA